VTAEMSGFEKTVRTGVRVDVNQNVTVNLSLKVSGSSQTVDVKSQAEGLDAQDATTAWSSTESSSTICRWWTAM